MQTTISTKLATAQFDLCVIGSGPAGIILLLEYLKRNPSHHVVLVEYGYPQQGRENSLDDTVKIKNTVNHHDPYECTNKGLGGTSLTWGGRCVMYDEIDFMNRSVIGNECTWDPQLFQEVKKFTDNAASYFECGQPVFDLDSIPEFKGKRIAENFRKGNVIDTVIERWSMPTRFGQRYRKQLEEFSNLVILEGVEARDFSEPDEHGKISSLKVRNRADGGIHTITSAKYVIAAGAQESTRILLRNKHMFRNLSSVPRALGKYYQSHVVGKIASVVFNGNPRKTEYGFLRNSDGTYIRRRFQFTDKFLLQSNLLNTAIWLDNPHYHDPKHKNGSMSFMYLSMITPGLGKRLAPPAIAYSITKGRANGIRKHIWNLVKDLPGSVVTPATIFYKRYLLKRKLPGIFLFNRLNTYALNFHAEQIPVADNRMELAPDSETLSIHYKITDEDINSVIRVHEELDSSLRESGCGKLEYWFKKEELPEIIKKISKDGIHQIGTTRIADSPERGVVDRDLKVWGTQNIFVCSSSVFPTSGQANPTFFLGAFASRLATHLS